MLNCSSLLLVKCNQQMYNSIFKFMLCRQIIGAYYPFHTGRNSQWGCGRGSTFHKGNHGNRSDSPDKMTIGCFQAKKNPQSTISLYKHLLRKLSQTRAIRSFRVTNNCLNTVRTVLQIQLIIKYKNDILPIYVSIMCYEGITCIIQVSWRHYMYHSCVMKALDVSFMCHEGIRCIIHVSWRHYMYHSSIMKALPVHVSFMCHEGIRCIIRASWRHLMYHSCVMKAWQVSFVCHYIYHSCVMKALHVS